VPLRDFFHYQLPKLLSIKTLLYITKVFLIKIFQKETDIMRKITILNFPLLGLSDNWLWPATGGCSAGLDVAVL